MIMLTAPFVAVAGLLLAPTLVVSATVRIGHTALVGLDIPSLGQEFFGGIPYAEAPTGNLRLQPPVRKFFLDVTTLNATNFGPRCLQPIGSDVLTSEDCLTINVFRLAGITPGHPPLPVMAFIHGGGFAGGGSADYNASAIVSQSVRRGTPIIYASFNYRLGPLGFPQGREAASRNALNLGLKDQVVALEWIQHNIAAFGGDKTKVTVFGESAGSMSIATLYFNSGLQNLVRGAIFESGQGGATVSFPAAHGQIDWDHFIEAVPTCAAAHPNTFRCIRGANSSDLQQAIVTSLAKANEEFPWVPTLDGPGGVFPDLPSRLYAKGQFAKVPFISGTNLDEGTIFTPQDISSSQTIHDGIVSNYSDSPLDAVRLDAAASRILELYPDVPALGSPFGTGNETFGLSSQYKRFAAITGDLMFQAPRRLWTQAAARAGLKSFGYLFTGPTSLVPANGVQHALDLLYVFPGLMGYPKPSTPSGIRLSGQMIDYWISFATSLDPNDGRGNDRPLWPQYTLSNQVLLELNEDNVHTIPDDYRAAQIEFINSDPSLFRH